VKNTAMFRHHLKKRSRDPEDLKTKTNKQRHTWYLSREPDIHGVQLKSGPSTKP